MIDVAGETVREVATAILLALDPELPGDATTPSLPTLGSGDAVTDALALIRHLRQRTSPPPGYPAVFGDALRAAATPETVALARADLDRRLGIGIKTALAGDGRDSLLGVRPETLLIAATTADFERFAAKQYADRPTWGKAAHHTIGNLVNYLQAVWCVPACPDAAILPTLGFLLLQAAGEWSWARRWHEAMLGTQGHNWWVAEFGMFYRAGAMLPEFSGLAQFRAFAPTFFEREMTLLYAPDGFSRETSVAYHSGTSDLYLAVVRIAERQGVVFSAAFLERLRLGYEVEWKMMTPDGNLPAFGDCWYQGGYALKRAPSVAALIGVPEAKYLAELHATTPETTAPAAPFGAMLLEGLHYPTIGEDLRPAYDALPARAPASLDIAFPDSGYYVTRSGWGPDADYLAIEASPRGNLVTSHGHGAIFDLSLYSRGRLILAGNGKGPCGSPEPERSWRVGCGSHNVATVDGGDHLPLKGVYRFANVVLPVVDEWRSEPASAYFSGVHEAYNRLPQAVPGVRRKVYYQRGRYWLLIDRFTPENWTHSHRYAQRFQLATGARFVPGTGRRVATTGAGGNLLFVPVGDALPCPTLGPCPYPLNTAECINPLQLEYSQRHVGPCTRVLLLVPFLDDALPEVVVQRVPLEADGRVLEPFEATALTIAIDGGAPELHIDLHMAWNLPWRCLGHRGSARHYHAQV